jgi:hypothetical protein
MAFVRIAQGDNWRLQWCPASDMCIGCERGRTVGGVGCVSLLHDAERERDGDECVSDCMY